LGSEWDTTIIEIIFFLLLYIAEPSTNLANNPSLKPIKELARPLTNRTINHPIPFWIEASTHCLLFHRHHPLTPEERDLGHHHRKEMTSHTIKLFGFTYFGRPLKDLSEGRF